MKAKLLLTAALLMPASIALAAPATDDVTGNWRGTLDAGPVKLRVVFRINKSTGGELTAKMDSLDQGSRDIPVEGVSVKGKTLRMEVKSVNGVYEGTLNTTGTKVTGEWKQGQQALPLALEKGQGTDIAAEAENLPPAELAANKLAARKLAGIWSGSLAAGAMNLRLRVNISQSPAGTAIGTLDSLDQGANGIPLSAITLSDGKVHFEARGIGGVYEGTLAADGLSLTGHWKQSGQTLTLEFKKAAASLR